MSKKKSYQLTNLLKLSYDIDKVIKQCNDKKLVRLLESMAKNVHRLIINRLEELKP